MIDASEVTAFAARVERAAAAVDEVAVEWKDRWGEETVTAVRTGAPRRTGHLAASVHEGGPGEVRIDADYWRFLERGTSKMAPRPFVGPAVARLIRPAAEDAAHRAARLIIP